MLVMVEIALREAEWRPVHLQAWSIRMLIGMSDQDTRSPTAIDRHVGARLRELRLARAVSQEALAEALGVTSQQVQKYESGSNRLSASRLFQVSEVLQVSVASLYEGLTEEAAEAPPLPARGRIAEAQVTNLARSASNLTPKLRSHIVAIVQALGKKAD